MRQGAIQNPSGLELQGIQNVNTVYWNLSTPHLIEEAIRRREGRLAHLGPLVVRTGQHTGRSPNDKFIVQEPSSADKVWWGKVNRPFDPVRFDALKNRLCAYLQGKDMTALDLGLYPFVSISRLEVVANSFPLAGHHP